MSSVACRDCGRKIGRCELAIALVVLQHKFSSLPALDGLVVRTPAYRGRRREQENATTLHVAFIRSMSLGMDGEGATCCSIES
jgi:hypothetical protein